MLELLLFAPLAAGLVMLLPVALPRRALLVATAVLHTALTVLLVGEAVRQTLPPVSGRLGGSMPGPRALGGLLAPDALGWLFLLPTSVLFLAAAIYAVGYLRDEAGQPSVHQRPGGPVFGLSVFFPRGHDSGDHHLPSGRAVGGH